MLGAAPVVRNSIFINVVKSMNSEKTHQQSVNPRSENIWVGLQVTECTSSSIRVSVGTFDIDF